MTNQVERFGMSVDLGLRAAGYVAGAKEVERAATGMQREIEKVDTAANKTRASFKQFGTDAGSAARSLDEVGRAASRARSQIDAVQRSAALTNFAKFSKSVVGNVSGGALSNIVGSSVGSAAGNVAGDVVGSALGSGAAQAALAAVGVLSIKFIALAAVVGGAVLALKAFADSLLPGEFDAETKARIEAAQGSQSAALAAQADAENRLGATMDTKGNLQTRRRNIEENLAFWQDKLQSSTRELAAAREELAGQSKLLAASEARLAALSAGRAAATGATGDAAFRMAAGAAGAGNGEAIALARVTTLMQGGRTLASGGSQDAARAKFAEASDVLEELFRALGSPVDRLREFQVALASISNEIDASFQASIEETSKTAANAAGSVMTLTAEVASLESATTKAANEIVVAMQWLEQNAKQFSTAMQAEAGALAQLAAARQAQAAGVAAESAAVSEGLGLVPAEGHSRGLHPPGPTDTVPALLSPGETVLTRDQTKALGPALKAAGVPGFATGSYGELMAGTRRYSAIAGEAQRVDSANESSAWNAMAADRMRAFGESWQQAYAAVRRRQEAGLPPTFPGYTPAPSIAAGLAQGFQGGGLVTPASQHVTVGDINIDYKSQGGTHHDARSLGTEIARLVKLGFVKFN